MVKQQGVKSIQPFDILTCFTRTIAKTRATESVYRAYTALPKHPLQQFRSAYDKDFELLGYSKVPTDIHVFTFQVFFCLSSNDTQMDTFCTADGKDIGEIVLFLYVRLLSSIYVLFGTFVYASPCHGG